MDEYTKALRARFGGLVLRFTLENHKALAFIAGWAAYPIGTALLCLLLP